jgi:hypothetical protein
LYDVLVIPLCNRTGKALNEYWKLKAIDSINVTFNGELPEDQFHRIIDKLIDKQEIKNILLKQVKVRSSISETEIDQISALNLYQRK